MKEAELLALADSVVSTEAIISYFESVRDHYDSRKAHILHMMKPLQDQLNRLEHDFEHHEERLAEAEARLAELKTLIPNQSKIASVIRMRRKLRQLGEEE